MPGELTERVRNLCHHYTGSRNPPQHLANEFSIRSNLYQLNYLDAGYYPLKQVPIIRLDQGGEREMVAADWGLLPFWWKPSDKTPKRGTFQRKCAPLLRLGSKPGALAGAA